MREGEYPPSLTDEVVETAAQAAYKVVCENAPKYYGGTQLERFVPWGEIGEDWRFDYKRTIRAALEAAWFALRK